MADRAETDDRRETVDDPEPDRLLSLAQERRPYLRLLSAAPRHKRDVIDDLGDSRSTVDRAIEALHGEGLVTRTDDGAWVTTTKGDVLFETVGETRETVAAVGAASDLLPHLPCAESVPPALFRDAAVEVATGPAPLAVADRVVETVADADSIRGFAVADHDVGVKEILFDATLADESFTFDYVFDASLVETLRTSEEVPWSGLLDAPNARLTVSERLPFGLMLTEHGDTTRLVVIVYDDQTVVRGQIRTPNPEAVAWGEEVFERYRADATPLADWPS